MEIISLSNIDWFVIIKECRPAIELVTSYIYNNTLVYHQPRMGLSISICFAPIRSTDILCFDTLIQQILSQQITRISTARRNLQYILSLSNFLHQCHNIFYMIRPREHIHRLAPLHPVAVAYKILQVPCLGDWIAGNIDHTLWRKP